MKARVTDRQALQQVEPADLETYLASKGWIPENAGQLQGKIWTKHPARMDEVLVPSAKSLDDYALRVSQALETIERVENISQIELLTELAHVGVDVIRVSAASTNERLGSITLLKGTDLVDESLNLLSAAAYSAITPTPVVPSRRPQQAEDYLRSVELGQSERGSYVFTILSKIRRQLTPGAPGLQEVLDAPFPRQVTRILSQALAATKLATQRSFSTGGIEHFRNVVLSGVSANLCEALEALVERGSPNKKIGIDIRWAVGFPASTASTSVEFEEREAEILADAARLFRESAPSEGIWCTGVVVNLHRERDDASGVATVSCAIEGVVRRLKVPLSRTEYEIAIEAHRERKAVLFRADIRKMGRSYTAENLHGFRRTEE